MAKHATPDPPPSTGKPVGNTDPNKRGRGGEPVMGQPPPGRGKHSK